MIARIGLLISKTIGRFIPDPFVLALGLTVLTAILAVSIGFPSEDSEGSAVVTLFDAWWNDSGIWKFLLFGMQMCLILVTGFALATSRPVRRAIQLLADLPSNSGSAAAMISVIAMLVGLINWGLGLIVGALLAHSCGRSLERRSIAAHYPLICAAGYTGMLVWHGGLSGSAPLTMTTSKGFNSVLPKEVVEELGIESVPLGDTIFSGLNIMVTIGLLVLVPLTLYLLAPRTRDQITTTADLGISDRDTTKENPAERDSVLAIILNCVVGLALLVGTVAYLATPEKGFRAHRSQPDQCGDARPGDAAARFTQKLHESGRGSCKRLCGDHRSIPPVRRHHDHDECLWTGGHDRECCSGRFHRDHPAIADLPQCGSRELLRSIRRWAMGRAGTDRSGSRGGCRYLPEHDDYVRGIWRRADQHAPAVLGAATAGDNPHPCKCHCGLHRDRDGSRGAVDGLQPAHCVSISLSVTEKQVKEAMMIPYDILHVPPI